jgi:hypothetical protein
MIYRWLILIIGFAAPACAFASKGADLRDAHLTLAEKGFEWVMPTFLLMCFALVMWRLGVSLWGFFIWLKEIVASYRTPDQQGPC